MLVTDEPTLRRSPVPVKDTTKDKTHHKRDGEGTHHHDQIQVFPNPFLNHISNITYYSGKSRGLAVFVILRLSSLTFLTELGFPFHIGTKLLTAELTLRFHPSNPAYSYPSRSCPYIQADSRSMRSVSIGEPVSYSDARSS